MPKKNTKNLLYYSLVLIFTLVNSLLSQDQKKKDVTGYKELKWGWTIEKVHSIYTKMEKIEGGDNEIKNSEQWAIKYSKGSVSERIFIFWKNELVKVSVNYRFENSKERGKIVMLFMDEYGWPDNTDEYRNSSNDTVIEISWKLGQTEIILIGDSNQLSAKYKSIEHFEKIDNDFKPEF